MPISSSEHEITFFESKTKNEVLKESLPEIATTLHELDDPKYLPAYRSGLAKGMVFEKLAVNEYLANSNETESQKGARSIIEKLYKNSALVLGEKNVPSTPDYVSVAFDKDGKLEIDKVIEIKLTAHAQNKGIEKDQPKHTIDTIEKIVEMVNLLIDGKQIKEIDTADVFRKQKMEARTRLLWEVKKLIKDLKIKDHVSISGNLEYIVILSKGQNSVNNSGEVITPNRKVSTKTIESDFSLDDVENVIDHYSETP